MDQCNISVAMTTYNGEKYLAEQLDSIIEQTYPAREIVIVDDCSNDNTWNILREYSSKYSIIKIFQNDHNLGYNKNFAKAVSLCSCEWIAFADQDDIWLQDKFEKFVSALSNNPQKVLVYGQDIVIYSDHEKTKRIRHIESLSDVLWHGGLCGHAIMFNRKIASILVDTQEAFDYTICIYSACLDGAVGIDDVTQYWRRHDSATTFVSSVLTTANNAKYDVQKMSRLEAIEVVNKLISKGVSIRHCTYYFNMTQRAIEWISKNVDRQSLFVSRFELWLWKCILGDIAHQTILSMFRAGLLNVICAVFQPEFKRYSQRDRVAKMLFSFRQPYLVWIEHYNSNYFIEQID